PVTIGAARVFFLDVRRIRQHECAEVARSRRAEDPAAIPLGHEARQIPAVIEVRVREDDGVDLRGVERQSRPVSQPKLLEALKQSAIDEDFAAIEIEKMLRPGDGSGRTEKRERRHAVTILDEMVTRLLRLGLLAALTIVLVTAAPAAQQRLLTLDDIYGPTNRVNFSGAPRPTIEWIDGDHYAWASPAGEDRGTFDWMNVTAGTGGAVARFGAARAEAALAALPGVGAEEARRQVHSRDLIFNHAYSAAILTIGDDLYVVSFSDGRATRLTSAAGEEQEPTFSPDGSKV